VIALIFIAKLQLFPQMLHCLPFHFDPIGTDPQAQLATAKGVQPGGAAQPRQRYEGGQKSDDGSDR
jgi:hypothetical protein